MLRDGGADVAFSPGFLGGDGVQSVIKGSFFSQPDNGGYFDQDPGTPVLPGGGPGEADEILIAQFRLPEGTEWFLQGTADYVPGGADGFVSERFRIDIPAPGALTLFGLAGVVGARRRRG